MLSKVAVVAAVLTFSSTVQTYDDAGSGSYEQFLADFKNNIDIDAITLKVSKEVLEDRKYSHLREKLIENMDDEAQELKDKNATEEEWNKFSAKYAKKWAQYRKASNKTKWPYDQKRLEAQAKESKSDIDVSTIELKAKPSKETQEDRKFSHLREKLVEDMTDEAAELRDSDADEVDWAKFSAKYAKKWAQYRNASNKAKWPYEQKRLEAKAKEEKLKAQLDELNAKHKMEEESKSNLTVGAIGLKASQETKDSRKYSHMREKLIEDMEDEAQELRDNDATEEDWDKFKTRYAKKWAYYRHASNKTRSEYEQKRLEAEAQKEMEEESQKDLTVSAIGLKASQETKDSRKFSHLREKLIEDMADEAAELQDSDADEVDWAKFSAKYAKKWAQYRNASSKAKWPYDQKRLEEEAQKEMEEESQKDLTVSTIGLKVSQETKDSRKFSHLREKLIEDMVDEAQELNDKNVTQEEWDKFSAKYAKKWAKYRNASSKAKWPYDQKRLEAKAQEEMLKQKMEEEFMNTINNVDSISMMQRKVKKQNLMSVQEMADKYLELDGWKKDQPMDEAIQQMNQLKKSGASSDQWSDYCHQWSNNWQSQGKDYAQTYMSHCLRNLSDAFSNGEQAKKFWNVKESSSVPKKMTVSFDNLNSLIKVTSDDVDQKGLPINEWQMDQNTGHIIIYNRPKDGSEPQITHKNFYGDIQSTTGRATKVTSNDVQAQRDIAFMIFYFFIAFIISTMCLIYVFFQKTKHLEQNASAIKFQYPQRNIRASDMERSHRRESTNFGSNNLDHLSRENQGRFENMAMDKRQNNEFNLANF